MADDLDSGISLNINTFNKSGTNTYHERKKIGGTRAQRIKARRNIKRWKQNLPAQEERKQITRDDYDGTQDNVISRELETGSSGKPGDKDVTSKGSPVKEAVVKKKTGDVVSSLFRHNPDIPAVTSGKVTQVKERLFASDSFQDVPLHPYMISNLEKLGFTKMTSVQYEAIPRLVEGHDLMVKSQTGSGKTMAYAIPIIEHLAKQSVKLQRRDGCQAIIIVPTRELALQSYDVFLKLLKPFTWIVPGCIMGGEKRKAEKARLWKGINILVVKLEYLLAHQSTKCSRLRKGINILVATPGRLIDHIENTESLLLDRIKWLVLDEADRLLDLGFEAKVAHVIQSIDQQSTHRQTVLLSATLTEGVERLAGISLKNPQRVAIDKQTGNSHPKTSQSTVIKSTLHENSKDMKTKTESLDNKENDTDSYVLPESLKQYFVITPCKLRLVVLLTLIMTKCKKGEGTKMLVFVSTQDGVEFLYRLLHHLSTQHKSSSDSDQSDSDDDTSEPVTSLDVYRLHGNMSQKDRTSTFQQYCKTRSGILLCTDVAARGLHLPSVHWVVQYSCAAGITDYVHRVGRTARAGSTGNTVMFLLPSEIDFVKHLNQKSISISEMKVGQILKDVLKLVPALPGMEDTERQTPRTVEEAATYLQNCCEMFVKKDKSVLPLAKSAYQSYIRAYATYPHHLKSVFHIRHLHLGHVAKTFGLREAPSNIGNIPGVDHTSLSKKRKHDKEKNKREFSKKRKIEQPSEFRGPLVFKTAKKKTKLKQKKKQKKQK